ncbi:MAG TPA: Ku protein [Methylomirabilota bacterium]|jgi:DNA end-binding protein Ku|nr:Ku protein [Methylomirabilota bacterium]
MPRSLRSAVLTFGLVTIPVRFYTATASLAPRFHLVHGVCGTRIRQQLFCPHCHRVVERSELVRGYEIGKGEDVTFTEEELKELESEASPAIDVAEFVPLETVDPVYYETAYYLGPDEGGEKAYGLLAEAMRDSAQVALARFVWREKENIAAIRAFDGGLVLHTLFFADEVRDFGAIDKGKARVSEAELRLARRLIDELRSERFEPTRYEDIYRQRIARAARQKAKGQTVRIEAPAEAPAKVVDLVDALRASLGRRKPPAKAGAGRRPHGRGATARVRRGRRGHAA